ncbi:MAG: molybdopterin-dependent oxidoreductase [Anaerolineae bacterium]|nr:molybdopterin-dependent oxidoreductase [Anaerolineae bacterium]
MTKETLHNQPNGCDLSRRDFLRISAVTGGVAFLGTLPFVHKVLAQDEVSLQSAYVLAQPENQIYTVCLQCNTGCPIKVKLLDGVAAKIDGNPYSPWTMAPHINYETPVADVATMEGAICPKGQSGLQTVYDPYRLVSVLKRKPGTKRGGGEWETITFDQAIAEVVNGGDLFGEGTVPGLKESYVLTDAKVAKDMAAAITKIQDEKEPEAKLALVEEFKVTFADYLDTMIDPDHPDMGPKNNQFVFAWGRLKDARKDFISRFLKAYGTNNAHGHTTVCQGSLYFTGKAMSETYTDGKWTGGSKFYWQGDVQNSRFVLFVGASPFEGNYGPPLRVKGITNGLVNGLKMAVVDPRLSKTAAKAWKWLPALPGTEAALALAMIQWVIDNGRYDARYLSAANKAAADAIGEPTWTPATWLVKLDEHGQPGKFLRASEIGLREKEERPTSTDPEKTYEFDYFVALVDGQPTPVDPYDTETAVHGDLLVDNLKLGDYTVKSGLQIISDSAHEHTLQEWADICGVRLRDIEEIAFEFTNYGKQAVADIHRGVSQHTNGFYNVLAWYTLNALIGNYDHAGGLIKATTYKYDGSKAGQPYKIGDMSDSMAPFGTSIIRHGEKYDKNTLFLRDGYPAKRNWYYLSSDIYQEIVPSIGDAYPYPAKALMLYMGSPVYSLPAGNTNIAILSDPQKLPLFIAIDPFIGETSMYADYIFPDTMYLERWEFGGSHPNNPFKVQPVRNPAIDPLVPDVTVFGQQTPMSLEAVLLGIAEEMELPGFGPGGYKDYGDFSHPDDLYIKALANLAFGEKEDGSDSAPDADAEEMRIFKEARRHLRKSVYDEARWQAIAGDLWPKVVYMLNRGGRFEAYEKGYKQGEFPEAGGEVFGLDLTQVSHPFGTMLNLYQEKTYDTKSAMTGEHLVGYAKYLPGPFDVTGERLQDEKDGYDLRMITYREITQTKSRTSSNYWLLAVLPENFVLINAQDAAARGLANGDHVKIVSASNPNGEWDLLNGDKVPMVGKVKTTQGIRPGVIGFGLGFGHWAYGSRDVQVNGQTIPGDGRRAQGIHANAAMRVDPYLGNTTLVDPVGGSAVFYDTQVKLVKV